MTEPDEPQEFTWSWTREAGTHELSAHGREVQARHDAGPPPPPTRPSAFKRLRFRFYLLTQRRRDRGSVSDGGA